MRISDWSSDVCSSDLEAAMGKAARAPQAPASVAAETAPVAPTTAEKLPFEPDFEVQPASSMRKVIAKRLSESKRTIPHFYLSVDCEIDALLAMRKQLNERADGKYSSEERRVGKECVSTCRSRWSP